MNDLYKKVLDTYKELIMGEHRLLNGITEVKMDKLIEFDEKNLTVKVRYTGGIYPPNVIIPSTICMFNNIQDNIITDLNTPRLRLTSLTIFVGYKKLPENIHKLCDLEELLLFSDLNKHKPKELPESIGQLHKLKRLVIWDHDLQTLPQSIGNLTNLQKIRIEDTPLTTLPETMGNLYNLEELHLENNKLITLPDSINKLPKLWSLIIENNRIDLFTWKGNPNLTTLELNSCGLETIPLFVFSLHKLQTLILRNNNLRKLPDQIASLHNLRLLNLCYNPITELSDKLFTLRGIRVLSFASTKIQEFPIGILKLKELRDLDIHTTPIQSIPRELCYLPNFNKLICTYTAFGDDYELRDYLEHSVEIELIVETY